MGVARTILLVALIVLMCLLALEMLRRSRLSTLVSPGQYRLRIVIVLVFMGDVLMMAVGTYLLAGASPLIQICYWTGCLILALIMVVAAIVDVRATMVNYLVEKRRILHEKALHPHDNDK